MGPVPGPSSKTLTFTASVTSPGGTPLAMQAHVTLDPDGQARVEGAARVQDGASNTIMVAEDHPDMSCADLDDDGIAGLTEAVIDFRATRSGELFKVTVLPTDGEADERGRHPAAVTLTGGAGRSPRPGRWSSSNCSAERGPTPDGQRQVGGI